MKFKTKKTIKLGKFKKEDIDEELLNDLITGWEDIKAGRVRRVR